MGEEQDGKFGLPGARRMEALAVHGQRHVALLGLIAGGPEGFGG